MLRPEYDRRRVGAFLGLGVGFAASALLFAALGLFLDDRLGTTPLFTILGAFVGGAAGFYSLYRHAVTAGEEDDGGTGSRNDGDVGSE